jgi:hypothetical protein
MEKELKDEFGNIFVQVENWKDKNITYVNWIGDNLIIEDIKKGAMLGLKEITESKTPFIINDNRQVTGVWDEVNDWLANEWMPKAIEAGLRKFAHIITDDLFGQLSAEFMEENSKKVEGNFQMRLFNNQEEAEEWLAE